MKHRIIKWLLRKEDSNLTRHAEGELQRAGLFDADSDYGGMLGHAIMDMVRLFAMEGHSGFSAARTVALFKTLANFGNLTPITSDPTEWNDISDLNGSPMWQSRRNPSLFSKDGGMTYYSVDDPKREEKQTNPPKA